MSYSWLLLGAVLLCAQGYAAPDAGPGPNADTGSPGSRWHEHREQRLQSALENGSITPAEAERLRQHWQHKDEQRRLFLDTLTPEQRQRLQRMEADQRARRREFMDSLTPQQRQQLRLQRQGEGDGDFDEMH